MGQTLLLLWSFFSAVIPVQAFFDEIAQLKTELQAWETTHAADFSDVVDKLGEMSGPLLDENIYHRSVPAQHAGEAPAESFGREIWTGKILPVLFFVPKKLRGFQRVQNIFKFLLVAGVINKKNQGAAESHLTHPGKRQRRRRGIYYDQAIPEVFWKLTLAVLRVIFQQSDNLGRKST